MTDHDTEILDAYARLGGSLASPGDPLPGVRRTIRRRRAVRRGALAVAALAVVGGVGGAVALQGDGSGDDIAAVDEPTATPTPTGPTSTLAFTRTDGTAYLFDATSLSLTCAPGSGSGEVMTLTTTTPRLAEDGETLLEPLLYVEVLVDKVPAGTVFTVPFDVDSGSDDRPLTFFFATPEGGKRANELSSAESGSSGSVTIEAATCGPTPSLSLSIDATLGSELQHKPPMAIAGSYHS